MSFKWAVPLVCLLCVSLIIAGDSLVARAQSPLAPQVGLSTSFTYQGQLKQSGAPANGSFDFQFALFDALELGTQVGSTLARPAVAVSGGYFNVPLDFGPVFDGSPRYLEIAVQQSGATAFTTLSPRQALTAAPYANYANAAGTASVASSVPWTGVTGAPAPVTYTAGSGLSLAGNQFSADTSVLQARVSAACPPGQTMQAIGPTGTPTCKSTYARTVIVGPVGNGSDSLANGTALIAALGAIPIATASAPYLLKLEPGYYDLGSTPLQMRSFVDIEGSGEQMTTINAAGTSTTAGTVIGANFAGLRYLTVVNQGGASFATAIYNNGAAPNLTHVTALASGGPSSSFGIFNVSASPAMANVTAKASGATNSNYAIYNESSYNDPAGPELVDLVAYVSGTAYNQYAIVNQNSSPRISRASATAYGGGSSTMNIGIYLSGSTSVLTDVRATASQAPSNYAVQAGGTSAPTFVNLVAEATNGPYSFGYYNGSSTSSSIRNSVFKGSGSSLGYGLYSGYSGSSVTVENSQVVGSTGSVFGVSGFTARLGASRLEGAVGGGGSFTCAASYNGSFAPLNATCQ